jgi:ABC-type multidrug transport system fused ATPase/permease subunit
MRTTLQVFLALLLWSLPSLGLAQPRETAVNNREVVERLTRLEEGQKALAQRLEEVNLNLGKRIEEVNANLSKHIEEVNASLNRRIDDLRAEMLQRFEQVDKRFEDVSKRFEDVSKRFEDVSGRFNDVMTMLQIIVSTLVALVLAIAGAGLVMWRKILTVDAVVQTHVQTKIGFDQVVRDQMLHLEQEIGFVKGKLKELSESLGKG